MDRREALIGSGFHHSSGTPGCIPAPTAEAGFSERESARRSLEGGRRWKGGGWNLFSGWYARRHRHDEWVLFAFLGSTLGLMCCERVYQSREGISDP